MKMTSVDPVLIPFISPPENNIKIYSEVQQDNLPGRGSPLVIGQKSKNLSIRTN